MNIRVLSDLHLEFWPFEPEHLDVDAIVLAGDIAAGVNGLYWAREAFPRQELIYVAGNHEFYGGRLPDAISDLSMRAGELGIHFLEQRSLVLGDVRFLGATLWTDYAIYAANDEHAGRFMFAAKRGMNDYRHIRFGPKRKKGRDRVLPGHLLELHQAARGWLTAQLATPFAGRTVVITHHAPHRLSVPAYYENDEHTPCYVSHIPELVRSPVDLWIHGHIHESLDYTVDGTRVLTNPRGYKPPDENPVFDPNLVVEI